MSCSFEFNRKSRFVEHSLTSWSLRDIQGTCDWLKRSDPFLGRWNWRQSSRKSPSSSAYWEQDKALFRKSNLHHNDALPMSFTQMFQTGNQIDQYPKRYSDFYRPHTCRTNIHNFAILFQGSRIWNSLPFNIKNAPSFSDQTIFRGKAEWNLNTLTPYIYIFL